MSKIMLIGYNPPALERDAKIEAAHYRTWQFLDPLLEDGHQICLVANTMLSTRSAEEAQSTELPHEWGTQLEHHPLALHQGRSWSRDLQKVHDDFQPDCIVAVNFDCCLAATKLNTDRPIWMDIYGDYMTIVQAACYRAGQDRGISTSVAFFRQVLKTGDAFSGCGTPQKHMLAGELAFTGRLNAETFGYEYTHVVLPGSSPKDGAENAVIETPSEQPVIPEEAFVVLWCGGYNTWTDVDTLFAGLEMAMEKDPDVHFLSVGANTYEGADNVYDRFKNMIAKSKFKDRYHMLGWRPYADVAYYYRESDVGLNIDAMHYETVYGTRTRLVEMIASGLPVITSTGCELSDLIDRKGAGLIFNTADWQGLGKQILRLATNRPYCREMAKVALNYAQNDLSFGVTTMPVRNWVKNPTHAPDGKNASSFKQFEYQARSVARQLIWRFTGLGFVANRSARRS